MALQLSIKQKFSEMTAKQKITSLLFVIVLVVIAWQVMGLFKNKSTGFIPKAPQTSSTGEKPSFTQNSATVGGSSTSVSQSQGAREVKQAALPVDNNFLKFQKEREQRYVERLNELESLKIQREIAEMNVAIATAKLETVTKEKNISDLLTKPAPRMISTGEYADRLVAPVASGSSVISPVAAQPIPEAAPADISYTVISVSMQSDKWGAVMGYQGKLYSVSVGDVLPTDGSTVSSINDEGVVLKKNGKTRKISLVPSI